MVATLSHCLFCDKREDAVEYMVKPESEPVVRVYPLGVCSVCAEVCACAVARMREAKKEETPTCSMGFLGVGETEKC